MMEKIKNAKPEEIGEMLEMILTRYRELYPDWDIVVYSLEKKKDRNEQIDEIIALLTKMRDLNLPSC